MRSVFLARLAAVSGLALAAVMASMAHAAPAAIILTAKDGVLVHGDYYAAPRPKALILLFHQAGSGKGEYAAIAPRLVQAGYSALAIDQRSGGNLFGGNATAAGIGHPTSYLEAQRDLEAAVAWGRGKHLPLALWGSSYSASLVFVVAAEQPADIKAVLAFSPGEYFDDDHMIRRAAAKLDMAVYITSADTPEEIRGAGDILGVVPAPVKQQYVPKSGGVHGSSTLIAARDPKGAADNWNAVLAFLARALP